MNFKILKKFQCVALIRSNKLYKFHNYIITDCRVIELKWRRNVFFYNWDEVEATQLLMNMKD